MRLLAAVLLPTSVLAQDAPPARADLERAVAAYFAADDNATNSTLAAAMKLARGNEALLIDVVTKKTFVARTTAAIDQRGIIDASYRFVADAPVPDGQRNNEALLAGPAGGDGLFPLVVYVPDATNTAGYGRELRADGIDAGRFVFLVPDEKRDNRYAPSLHEHRRHAGPLRELLLTLPIDPDRVYMVGSGRGGHATWDVGLTCADRWAGIFPCNGGLVHEGGWKASGGVFVGNARCFATFLVFNTSFDHGIVSCRYAVKKLREWNCRIDAVEEPQMRVMSVGEAMGKLAPVVRNAHPRRIEKRFNHLVDGEHYWLRALDRKGKEWDPAAKILVKDWPKDPAQQLETVWNAVEDACGHLAGTIAGNRFDVTAHGMGKVCVYLDPELVDFDAPVTFAVNGKVVKTLKPARQLEVMLQHVRETGDTSRLYFAFVDLPVGP
ncbi:MAG TPA: hypothetical protein VFX21_05070 [Acidimicrobiia bacterium]|nr:hypothetical protein [Acidimicrobiia bacterium]